MSKHSMVRKRREVCKARSTWSTAPVLLLLALGASAQEAMQEETSSPVSATAVSSNAQVKSGGVSAADVQNPIANLVSLPLQNNTYFDVGPNKSTVNELLIEPVVPFKLGANWEIITRTIVPLIYEPRTSQTNGATFGLGNVQPQFYLTPTHPGSVIWGIGPQLWLPTATDPTLGNNHLGGGAAAVVLTVKGRWLYGFLANQVWAAGNSKERTNQFTFEPFVFYMSETARSHLERGSRSAPNVLIPAVEPRHRQRAVAIFSRDEQYALR